MAKFSRSKTKLEGALIKTDDDEKQVLDKEVLFKAMRTMGGKLFWTVMFLSYLA